MTKQIIIEHPYKAVLSLNKNRYEVYHYDILDKFIMTIYNDKAFFYYPDKYYDFKILAEFITQCQSELNNQ